MGSRWSVSQPVSRCEGRIALWDRTDFFELLQPASSIPTTATWKQQSSADSTKDHSGSCHQGRVCPTDRATTRQNESTGLHGTLLGWQPVTSQAGRPAWHPWQVLHPLPGVWHACTLLHGRSRSPGPQLHLRYGPTETHRQLCRVRATTEISYRIVSYVTWTQMYKNILKFP